jgi:hypothetical protein
VECKYEELDHTPRRYVPGHHGGDRRDGKCLTNNRPTGAKGKVMNKCEDCGKEVIMLIEYLLEMLCFDCMDKKRNEDHE